MSDWLSEFWSHRELLVFFAWREVKIRYKQAALGAAWAIIQPLFGMIVFAVIFGRLAHMPSDGVPYPVFCYVALVPWTYFAGVVGNGGNSLVGNSNLLTKVYFPRVLLPASAVVAGLLDFVVSATVLVGLMMYYKLTPGWPLLLMPVFVLAMIMVTMGMSLLLGAMNVRYRDVKYVTPFLLQLWLFCTPIAYSSSLFPERFKPLLALNPFLGIVEGFRACLFAGRPVDWALTGTSLFLCVILFSIGAVYFHQTERSFADIV